MGTPPEDMGQPLQTEPQPALEAEAPARAGISGAQIAILVGAVVVLLALVWFFFLRGGGQEEVVAPPAAVPAPTEEPEAVEEPDGDVDDGPVETFEVFAPRDPFEPLISAAADGGGDAGGDEGTDTDGDGVVDTGADTDGDGVADGTTTTDDGEAVGGHRVKVVDVFRQGGADRAQIQVDGTVYTVDEGEDFADNFRLVSASGRCATMLFGDDEFTLCEGEEILK